MKSHLTSKRAKSIPALVFLTAIGIGLLLFGILIITCGFIINFNDDFEIADGGEALESTVEKQFDYTQYWLGFPFLITAIFSILSGTFQNARSLTFITLIFFHGCIILALFAMVLEGVDWVYWKNEDHNRRNWEDKRGYECTNRNNKCVCGSVTANKTQTISMVASCSNIASLSGLFGAIVSSAIFGIFLCLAGIVIMLKSLSWKPRYLYTEYALRRESSVEYHKNYGYVNGIVPSEPPRMAGNGASQRAITLD